MSQGRTRGWLATGLIASLVLVVVAVAIVVRGTSASAAGTRLPPSAEQAASSFAIAYFASLDGQGRAVSLPNATPAARRQASGAPIPAADRAGTVALSALHLSANGGVALAVATGRDAAHAFPAQISLVRTSAGWVVAGIVPPDLGTILAKPYEPRVPAAAQAAAAAFATAYVDYREGASPDAPRGAGQLAAELSGRQDPLHATTPTHRASKLISVAFGEPDGSLLDATVHLTDAGRPLALVLILRHAGGAWQPWWVLPSAG